MEFEFDRVFTPEEQALITKVGAIKLTLLGVNFSPVSIEDFYGCYNRMAFTLPTSITETMLPNLETLPFKLAVNVSAADAEFIGLSTGENALAPTNFWSLPSYIGYDASWLKTQGSEAHSLASVKELSSENIGCVPCNEMKVNPPTPIRTSSVDLGSTNNSAVIADVERKKSGSNADCCVVDIMAVPFKFYPSLEINTKMVHNAHTCADYHWVKYQHNPKHTCSDKIYANAPITLGKPAYVHHYLEGLEAVNFDGYRFFSSSDDPWFLDTERNWSYNQPVQFTKASSSVTETYWFPHKSDVKGEDDAVLFIKKKNKVCDRLKLSFKGDHVAPKVKLEIILPDQYENFNIKGVNPVATGCKPTAEASGHKNLIDEYSLTKCGAFLRVIYSDDQCTWGNRNLGKDKFGNYSREACTNGKVTLLMKPYLESTDPDKTNEKYYWQEIATGSECWVWGNEKKIEVYNPGTKTKEMVSEYEDWFVIPAGWFPMINQTKKCQQWPVTGNFMQPPVYVSAPGKINEDDGGYWHKWDFAAVVNDDYMKEYDETCNWTKEIDKEHKVPNLAWKEGVISQSYFIAHPELDPPTENWIESQFKIEYDEQKGPSPETLHTPIVDYSGRTIHFINDAKYTTDLSEEWKNYWIKLKVKFKLDMPPGVPIPNNVRLVLYLYDPELDVSGFDEPTNKYAVEAQKPYFSPYQGDIDKSDNQPEERGPDTTWSGFDTRDIPKDTVDYGVTYDEEDRPIYHYSYNDFSPKYHRLDVSLNELKDKIVTTSDGQELTVYFRTCRYGGNNYRVKGMIGIPTCYRWYELTKETGPIEVWKKYPLYFSQLYSVGAAEFKYKVVDERMVKEIKGSFDDTFCWVFPEPGKYQFIQITDDVELMNKIPIYNSLKWGTEISNYYCEFHQWSLPDVVNNIHIILYPYQLDDPDVGGFSNYLNFNWESDPFAVISMEATKKKWQTGFPLFLNHNIIHEIGHTIGHLSHQPKSNKKNVLTGSYEDVSVMNYYEAYIENDTNHYPWITFYEKLPQPDGFVYTNHNGSEQPVNTFSLIHNQKLREGFQDFSIPEKWSGFYYRRSNP